MASPITFYYSSVSSNYDIKQAQQRMEMVLESKGVVFEKVDISADADARTRMRSIVGDPAALPPQLCRGELYIGDYAGFEEAIEDNSHNFEDLYDYEDSMDHDASSTANQVLPPVPHNVVAPSNPPLFVAVNERGASTANQVFVPANEIRGRRLVDSDGKENSEGLGENVYDFDYIFEKDANGRRVVNPNAVTLRLVQAAEKKNQKYVLRSLKLEMGN